MYGRHTTALDVSHLSRRSVRTRVGARRTDREFVLGPYPDLALSSLAVQAMSGFTDVPGLLRYPLSGLCDCAVPGRVDSVYLQHTLRR